MKREETLKDMQELYGAGERLDNGTVIFAQELFFEGVDGGDAYIYAVTPRGQAQKWIWHDKPNTDDWDWIDYTTPDRVEDINL